MFANQYQVILMLLVQSSTLMAIASNDLYHICIQLVAFVS